MHLVTFEVSTPLGPVQRSGALSGEHVVDLSLARAAALGGRPRALEIAAAELPADLRSVLAGGHWALDTAREALAHDEDHDVEELHGRRVRHRRDHVRLLAPLPRPTSLRDYMVVEEHVRNCVDAGILAGIPPAWYEVPAHYKGNVDAVYGPEDTVPWPSYTAALDYELEICAVIGIGGRAVGAEDAHHVIAGYTIYNDWSARDIQRTEMSVGIGPGIAKDFATSLGPCIATPDEFDRDHARLEARVDGEVWSRGVLGAMHFSFEQIVEYTSQEATLQPGDLLGSGTVGRGCGVEIGRQLAEGCTVELEAEGIGVLRNHVAHRTP
jgi:2-keto-4-pentenoate hydratase/2-oxohepta-3-ene-1,7-dioic acid hydratase in catechol pathway